jgi:methionine-rich copper-binding protein CopC
VGLLLATASGASAHAVLRSTTPKAGAALTTLPQEITLTFDEPPAAFGDVVQVTGPSGDLVSQGKPKVVDDTVHQPLAAPSSGAAGTYQVTWHVTSDDGHPVSGTFRFTVAGSGTPTATPQTQATSPNSTGSTSASAPARTSSDGGSSWLYWVGLAVLLILVLLALLTRGRRSRTGRNPS